MSGRIAIQAEGLGKRYRLGAASARYGSLRERLSGSLRSLLTRPRGKQAHKEFWALRNASFTIGHGENVGIIGLNGAGKSTLLKILSRITDPTVGKAQIEGRVGALLEVGTGFHQELTGRENVYLYGSILGMRKAEIARKFDAIVEFAGIPQFIDTPVKRYSSGMYVRLAFAVAAHMEPDILLLDEVLAVGDLAFQRKCFDRMEELIRDQGRTVLLVSHNIRQVERICTRAILLDHGKIVADDDPRTVCNLFYERSEAKIRSQLRINRTRQGAAKHISSGEVALVKASIVDDSGVETDSVQHGADITIAAVFKANTQLNSPIFGVGFHTPDFLYLATRDSEDHVKVSRIQAGVFRLECRIRKFPPLAGIYALRIGVGVGNLASTVFYAENVLQFQVRPDGKSREQTMREGFISLDTGWHVEEQPEPSESAAVKPLLSRT